MKTQNTNQLTLNFPKVGRNFGKVVMAERTRDSDGKYCSECDEQMTIEDRLEMTTRMYLATAKQLAAAERELQKYKNV
jgi:hypothetical protein